MEDAVSVAEGIVETEQSAALQGGAAKVCLNCETPLTDKYCAHCGQKDIPARQTLGELLQNFISSFWSFESKFLKTGQYIFFRPGKLASDYNEGKRERYFHPARMYVFISFVYFLLLGMLPDPGSVNEKKFTNTGSEGWKYDKAVGNYKSYAQYDSTQKALPVEERDGAFVHMIMKRVAEVNTKYEGTDKDFSQDFSEIFFANTPKIFFLLLPLFAFILKILYIRRNYFYSEHLVFSIYYYNLFFLAGSLYLLLNQVPIVRNVVWILGIWIVVYLLFAMKHVYRQSWKKTIFKYGIFMAVFSFFIVLCLLGNALYIFMIL